MVRHWLGAHLLPWVTGVLPRLGAVVGENVALSLRLLLQGGELHPLSAREKVGPGAGHPDACWGAGQLLRPP